MQNKKSRSGRKQWLVRENAASVDRSSIEAISSHLGVCEVVARLLYSRGCSTSEEAENFVRMKSEMLHDPAILTDSGKAVDRIRTALDAGEKIAVYGDYDVDGVTAVCTLYLYLKSKGADITYYIPNRSSDGYGVSAQAVNMLAEQGVTLIITVDTGVTANEEVEFARTLGVDFVITDHHECRSDLPNAVAVVNPHRADCPYPFKDLAGVGVVFKLICAYEEAISGDSKLDCVRRICDDYADLVAIGTIADVMPIRDENKLIVSRGLKLIESELSRRIGLAALIEAASGKADGTQSSRSKRTLKITSGYIGYTIAPRINAAGRIRSASIAVELFLTEDPARATELAEELCKTNRERQDEENNIMRCAYEKIEANESFADDAVIVLEDDGWNHGVIGIVASRITEHYGKPTLLVSFDGNGAESSPDDVGKGSGRSIKGMNLVDALCHCSDSLIKFGGHELAAGLSVKRGMVEEFRRKINEYAKSVLPDGGAVTVLEADCEISPQDTDMRLAEEIRLLEPYGVGNPLPIFVMRGCRIVECISLSAGKHTKFTVSKDGIVFSAVYFSHSIADLDMYTGDTVDLMFSADINEYNGRRSLQLVLKDVRLSSVENGDHDAEVDLFERVWSGESFGEEDDIMPGRNDFAAVYNLVRHSVRMGYDTLSHRAIISKLREGFDAGSRSVSVGYVKLKIIIRVFQELNLLGIEEVGNEVYRFKLYFTNTKTELDKSNLLRRLRSQMR